MSSTISPKLKAPTLPTVEERFYDLFKTSLHGLCSQFENQHTDGLYPDFYDGASELERCKQIVERAWTLAGFAAAMFDKDESAIKEFNRQLNTTVKREEAERKKLYKEA